MKLCGSVGGGGDPINPPLPDPTKYWEFDP